MPKSDTYTVPGLTVPQLRALRTAYATLDLLRAADPMDVKALPTMNDEAAQKVATYLSVNEVEAQQVQPSSDGGAHEEGDQGVAEKAAGPVVEVVEDVPQAHAEILDEVAHGDEEVTQATGELDAQDVHAAARMVYEGAPGCTEVTPSIIDENLKNEADAPGGDDQGEAPSRLIVPRGSLLPEHHAMVREAFARDAANADRVDDNHAEVKLGPDVDRTGQSIWEVMGEPAKPFPESNVFIGGVVGASDSTGNGAAQGGEAAVQLVDAPVDPHAVPDAPAESEDDEKLRGVEEGRPDEPTDKIELAAQVGHAAAQSYIGEKHDLTIADWDDQDEDFKERARAWVREIVADQIPRADLPGWGAFVGGVRAVFGLSPVPEVVSPGGKYRIGLRGQSARWQRDLTTNLRERGWSWSDIEGGQAILVVVPEGDAPLDNMTLVEATA